MMQTANILPGQWQKHLIYRYAVWVHRLARAVEAEIKRLPEQPPPLPWPVYKKPINELRTYNSGLFPKFPAKPKRRAHANTYVPKTVNLEAARTEVYRPDRNDEDWLWRIKICWDEPRPWSVEAVVDRGGTLYLPFFRQVTIRLPLKAKICRELNAKKDGQWVGECNGVKKLNRREPIAEATRWLLQTGQGIAIDSGQWTMDSEKRTAVRLDVIRTNHPRREARGVGGQGTGSGKDLTKLEATHGSAPDVPAAHCSLLTAHSSGSLLTAHSSSSANSERLTANRSAGVSPGVAAYRAKLAARARKAAESRLTRRKPLEGAFHLEGFYPSERYGVVRYESALDKKRRVDRFEQELQEERDAIGFILANASWDHVDYGPGFLRGDDFDGYLLTRQELGPDPYDYDWPEPRSLNYLAAKWGRRRKPKRYATARDRLAKVKPSARIVPTGKRSAELVITRRLHELSFGLGEALNLARMIEGAIKFRDPLKPNRKLGWRQQLRSIILYRPGLLTWLVKNPLVTGERGEWALDFDGRAAHGLELMKVEALPPQYQALIYRDGRTPDQPLLEQMPKATFPTSIEGFRLRLPVAVMPAPTYERWQAQGGNKRRRRGQARRKRSRRGCYCYFRPPNLRSLPVKMTAQHPLFLRN